MTPPSPRRKLMFLVELWREPSASWRGIVKHVAHGAEHYVVELSDITEFIGGCIEAAAPDDDGPSDRIRTRR